jgi:hypothetical protein
MSTRTAVTCVVAVAVGFLIGARVAVGQIGYMENAWCNFHGETCKGAVVVQTNGIPLGCVVDDADDCSGDCYKCDDGTNDDRCEWVDEKKTCWYANVPAHYTSCGKRVKHTCSGVKPCTCGGQGQDTEVDCVFVICSTTT